MTGAKGRRLDETSVVQHAFEVIDVINSAALGLADWSAVTKHIHELFPHIYIALESNNLQNGTCTHFSSCGYDDKFIREYSEYYYRLNPWKSMWERAPNGHVAVSEEVSPMRLFRETEFYRDMFRRLDADAACGLKIATSPTDLVFMPIHYPLKLAETYDPAIKRFLELIRGNFAHVANLALKHRDQLEDTAAVSSLVARNADAAVVIDGEGRILAANAEAEKQIEKGTPVRSLLGKLRLTDDRAAAALGQFLARVGRIEKAPVVNHLRTAIADGVLIVTRLPRQFRRGLAEIAPQRDLFLVQVRLANANAKSDALEQFARFFRLNASEMRLVALLNAGHDLQTCAMLMQISHETVRSRIKLVFAKTATHSQQQLLQLMGRWTH